MRCCCWLKKRNVYVYIGGQVEVGVAKSAIQANLSEYIFVLGRKRITLGRSFETNGRLLACVRPRDRLGSCSCDWPLVGQRSMSELRWRSRALASEVVALV